jgi:putative endonuclease
MGEDQRRRRPADLHARTVDAVNVERHALDRQLLGRQAEDAAEQFLSSRTHRVLLRNYRCRMGELDLVACDETRASARTLVIAEVRLRSRRDYGGGAASVDHRKQRKLLRAARHLLATHPELARLPVRFDVLDLAPEAGGYHVDWIRHAFSA